MTREILTVQLGEAFGLTESEDDDLSFEIGKEDLGGPLLVRAGVVDINCVFNKLTPELIDRLGKYPEIDGELWPIIFQLKQGALTLLGKEGYFYGGRDNVEHWLYPVTEDGMISEIAKTATFQRLFGVFQLGPSRHYPIHNFHTRAQHSIYFAVDSVRTLQTLDDWDSGRLLEVLKNDLEAVGLAEGLDDEQILAVSADLLVTSAMIHDLATPAGGDTIKYLLDLDEEKSLDDLLKDDSKILEVLRKRGMGRRHLDFSIKCIQGKSNSLIGQIIHPPDGDYMDGDRRGYTKTDERAIRVLDPAVPTKLLPEYLGETDSKSLNKGLDEIKEALRAGFAAITGKVHDEFLPVSLLDPSEDYVLNAGGKLVCTRPDKLAWLSAYRAWMIALHYAGPQMLGIEYELQEKLDELIKQGKTGDIFETDNLMRMTDAELYAGLSGIEDEELRGILDRKDSFAGTTLFEGEVEDGPVTKKCFAKFPIKIKPGLDSLVLDGGEEITLGKWLEVNDRLVVTRQLKEVIEQYQGKWLVVNKKKPQADILYV